MKNNFLIIIYLFLILTIYETINFMGITYSKVLFCISFFLFIYLLRKNKNEIKRYLEKEFSFNFLIGLVILTLIVSISTIFSIVSTKTIYLTNVYEIVRVILYILILSNMSLLLKTRNNVVVAKKFFTIFIIINCIVGITQFFNPFNINELYVRIIAPTQYVTLVNDYPFPRVIGLTGNPNVFGYILAITIIFFLAEIKKNPRSIKNYIIMLLLHITLYMTMSRTAFIITIFGEILFIFFSFINIKDFKNSLIKIIKYALIIVVIEIGILFVLPNNLTWRLKELVTLNKINSWQIRVENNDKHIDNFKDGLNIKGDYPSDKPDITFSKKRNIFIGNGADKNNVTEDEMYDNEYALIIVRYGIIGLTIYLMMFIYPLLKMKNYDFNQKALFIAVTLATLVYMYPAGIYHSFKLFGFLMIVYSFIDIKNENSKGNNNILVIATYFPPSGGVGVFRITKFVKYLQKFGYNVTVATVADKYNINKDESLMKNFTSNIKIHRLDFHSKKESTLSIKFYFAIRKNIKRIIEVSNPEKVLITGGPFYILPIGRYIKENFGIPYILDLRDPWSTQKRLSNNLKSKMRYTVDNFLESYTFNQASAIITVNDTMTNELCEKYPRLKNKIYSITNGFDPDDFKEIKPKKFKKFTIIYTGKFSVSAGFRNPENLFKAIKNLVDKDYDIDFIHIGQQEEKIIELALKYGLKKHCKFLGFMPYLKVLEYCKGANILVVISGKEKSEQTGKIFDYIGCNKPVLAITNKNNELYKICKHSKIVYQVNPSSAEEIENTIKKIYKLKENITIDKNIKLTREYLTKKLIDIIKKIEY